MPDPLAEGSGYQYRAQPGESTPYRPADPDAAADLAAVSAERMALQAERDRVAADLQALAVEVGLVARIDLADLRYLTPNKILDEIAHEEQQIQHDEGLSDSERSERLALIDDLHQRAEEYRDLVRQEVVTSQRLGEIGGLAYALDPELHPGAVQLTPFEGGSTAANVVDVAVLIPGRPPKLLVVEAKGVGSTLGGSRLADAQQGAPEYLRRTLAMDRNLATVLTESPEQMRARGVDPDSEEGRALRDARDDLLAAHLDGTLQIEYHQVRTAVDGDITVRRFDLTRDGEPVRIDIIGGVDNLDADGVLGDDEGRGRVDYRYRAQPGAEQPYLATDPAIARQMAEAVVQRAEQRAEHARLDAARARLAAELADFAQRDLTDLRYRKPEVAAEEIARQEHRVRRDPALNETRRAQRLAILDELREHARQFHDLRLREVATSQHLGELGGLAYALDPELHPGVVQLTPLEGDSTASNVVDIAALIPGSGNTPPKLLVVEAKGGGSPLGGSRRVDAQQGSPEYLRRTLAIDSNLARLLGETPAQLRSRGIDPDSDTGRALLRARDELLAAHRDGTLQVEYVVVRTVAEGETTVRRFDLERNGRPVSFDVIGGIDRSLENGGDEGRVPGARDDRPPSTAADTRPLPTVGDTQPIPRTEDTQPLPNVAGDPPPPAGGTGRVSDTELLGAPDDDAWSGLPADEVGARLRDELRAITGNPRFEVFGFDRPEVHPEVAREYARALVDMFAAHPPARLNAVGFRGGMPEGVFGHTRWMLDGGVRRADVIEFNADMARDPAQVRRATDYNAGTGWFPDSVRHRPAYARAVHEFGHVLDAAGDHASRRELNGHLLREFFRRHPDATSIEDYFSWLRESLSGYSFHPRSPHLNPAEALAEAFLAVTMSRLDPDGFAPPAPGNAVRIVYDLLVRSADEPPRSSFGWFDTPELGTPGPATQGPGPPDRTGTDAGRDGDADPEDGDGTNRPESTPDPVALDLTRSPAGRLDGWQFSHDPAAAQVREVLTRSEIGRHALQVLREAGATVRFEEPGTDSGRADEFNGRTMEVFIGSGGRGELGQAAAVIRAATLAEAVVQGRVEVTPSRIRELSETEHAAAWARVEGEALGRQARFQRDMGRDGYELSAPGLSDPLDAEYRRLLDDAYLDAYDAAVRYATEGVPYDSGAVPVDTRAAEVDRLAGIRDEIAAIRDTAVADRDALMGALGVDPRDVATPADTDRTVDRLLHRTMRADRIAEHAERVEALQAAVDLVSGLDDRLHRADMEVTAAGGPDGLPRRLDPGADAELLHRFAVAEAVSRLMLHPLFESPRTPDSAAGRPDVDAQRPARPADPDEYVPSSLTAAREVERLVRAQADRARELGRIETAQAAVASDLRLLSGLTGEHTRVAAERDHLLEQIRTVVVRDTVAATQRTDGAAPERIRIHIDESGVVSVGRDHGTDRPASRPDTPTPSRAGTDPDGTELSRAVDETTKKAFDELHEAARRTGSMGTAGWVKRTLDQHRVEIVLGAGPETAVHRTPGSRARFGTGAGYDPVTRTLTLHPGDNPAEHARQLVYAARMADQFADADPAAERLNLSRDEYSALMLDRVAEAHALAFRDLIGLRAQPPKPAPDDPLARIYADAFVDGYRTAESAYGSRRTLGGERGWFYSAGHRAGFRAVRAHLDAQGPLVGEVPLGAHFAGVWDRAHGISTADGAEPPTPRRIPEDTAADRSHRARGLADEVEGLRILRDLGRYVPEGPAETAFQKAYDKELARAQRRTGAQESPEQAARRAGVEALERYLRRTGLEDAEIAQDVVRAITEGGGVPWGHPKEVFGRHEAGPAERARNSGAEPGPDMPRRAVDRELDRFAQPARMGDRPERLTDRVLRVLDPHPRLVIYARPGEHLDALHELGLLHPEYSDAIWKQPNGLDYQQVTADDDGEPVVTPINRATAEGPYRMRDRLGERDQMLAHYLRFRAEGKVEPGFADWLKQLGPDAFYTREDQRNTHRPRTVGDLRDDFLSIGHRRMEASGGSLPPEHPAHVAHNVHTRRVPVGSSGGRHPNHYRLEVFPFGAGHLAVSLEPDGHGGWRVPPPLGVEGSTNVLSRYFQGMTADTREALVKRIVGVLNDPTAALTAEGRPRGRMGRLMDRMGLGADRRNEDQLPPGDEDSGRDAPDFLGGEDGEIPPADGRPDDDADTPALRDRADEIDDEWSGMGLDEIVATLRERYPLREISGFSHPDDPAVPPLDLPLVREIARAVDLMMSRFPMLELHNLRIAPVTDREHVRGLAHYGFDAGDIGRYVTDTITLNERLLRNPAEFYASRQRSEHNMHSPRNSAARPAFATTVHELGHGLDFAGGMRARGLEVFPDGSEAGSVELLLIEYYTEKTGGFDPDEFSVWLNQLGGYSFTADGELNRTEMLADAVLDVVLNGDDATEPARIIYGALLREALDNYYDAFDTGAGLLRPSDLGLEPGIGGREAEPGSPGRPGEDTGLTDPAGSRGTPDTDQWSELGLAEIGDRLRDHVRAATGNPDFEVRGFDWAPAPDSRPHRSIDGYPSRPPESVDIAQGREFARAIADLTTRHPRVALPAVEVVPGPSSRSDSIASADGALRLHSGRADSGDRTDLRSTYRNTARAFAEVMNSTTGRLAEDAVGEVLAQYYSYNRLGDQHRLAFLDWMQNTVDVFETSNVTRRRSSWEPDTILADAFAEVMVRGRDRAGQHFVLLHDLLVAQDGIEARAGGFDPDVNLSRVVMMDHPEWVLGAPRNDEWSALTPVEVGDKLRAELREALGNPELTVFGFDSDGLHPVIVREIARGLTDMARLYPMADIQRVGFGDGYHLSITVPGSDSGAGTRRPAVLTFDDRSARDIGAFAMPPISVEYYHAADSGARTRPVYANAVQQWARALDITGRESVHKLVDNALRVHYAGHNLGDASEEGYVSWLKSQFSEHVFETTSGEMDHGWALEEAFDQVVTRGRDGAGAHMVRLHDLLVRAADRNSPRAAIGRFLDQIRFANVGLETAAYEAMWRVLDKPAPAPAPPQLGATPATEPARDPDYGTAPVDGPLVDDEGPRDIPDYGTRPEEIVPPDGTRDSGDRTPPAGDDPDPGVRDRMAAHDPDGDDPGPDSDDTGDRGPELSDTESLGAPESDEWSNLSPEEVGERLRDHMREVTGNPDFRVFGFDLADLNPEIVREYARAITDMYARFPQADIRSVGIGDIREGVLADAGPALDPDTGSHYAEDITLNYRHATSIENFLGQIDNALGNKIFSRTVLRRPVYAITVHEFGHVLDYAGNGVARLVAEAQLLDRSAADPDGNFGRWLAELSGYSRNADGDLWAPEALAEALMEYVLRGADAVPTPVRELAELLIGVAEDGRSWTGFGELARRKLGLPPGGMDANRDAVDAGREPPAGEDGESDPGRRLPAPGESGGGKKPPGGPPNPASSPDDSDGQTPDDAGEDRDQPDGSDGVVVPLVMDVDGTPVRFYLVPEGTDRWRLVPHSEMQIGPDRLASARPVGRSERELEAIRRMWPYREQQVKYPSGSGWDSRGQAAIADGAAGIGDIANPPPPQPAPPPPTPDHPVIGPAPESGPPDPTLLRIAQQAPVWIQNREHIPLFGRLSARMRDTAGEFLPMYPDDSGNEYQPWLTDGDLDAARDQLLEFLDLNRITSEAALRDLLTVAGRPDADPEQQQRILDELRDRGLITDEEADSLADALAEEREGGARPPVGPAPDGESLTDAAQRLLDIELPDESPETLAGIIDEQQYRVVRATGAIEGLAAAVRRYLIEQTLPYTMQDAPPGADSERGIPRADAPGELDGPRRPAADEVDDGFRDDDAFFDEDGFLDDDDAPAPERPRRFARPDPAGRPVPFLDEVSFIDQNPMGRLLIEILAAFGHDPGLLASTVVENGADELPMWGEASELGRDEGLRRFFENALRRDQIRDELASWAAMRDLSLQELLTDPEGVVDRLRAENVARAQRVAEFVDAVRRTLAEPDLTDPVGDLLGRQIVRIPGGDGQPDRLLVVGGPRDRNQVLADALAADRSLAAQLDSGELVLDYRHARRDWTGESVLDPAPVPPMRYLRETMFGRELDVLVVRGVDGEWHQFQGSADAHRAALGDAPPRPARQVAAEIAAVLHELGIGPDTVLPENLRRTVADLLLDNAVRAVQLEALVDFIRSATDIEFFNELTDARSRLAERLGLNLTPDPDAPERTLTPKTLAEALAAGGQRRALRAQRFGDLTEYAKRLREFDADAVDAARNRLAERLVSDAMARKMATETAAERAEVDRRVAALLRPRYIKMPEPDGRLLYTVNVKEINPRKLLQLIRRLERDGHGDLVRDALAEFATALFDIDPFTEVPHGDRTGDPRIADGRFPMHSRGVIRGLRGLIADAVRGVGADDFAQAVADAAARPDSHRIPDTDPDQRPTPNRDWARLVGVDLVGADDKRFVEIYEAYRDGRIENHEGLKPEKLAAELDTLRREVRDRAERIQSLFRLLDEYARSRQADLAGGTGPVRPIDASEPRAPGDADSDTRGAAAPGPDGPAATPDPETGDAGDGSGTPPGPPPAMPGDPGVPPEPGPALPDSHAELMDWVELRRAEIAVEAAADEAAWARGEAAARPGDELLRFRAEQAERLLGYARERLDRLRLTQVDRAAWRARMDADSARFLADMEPGNWLAAQRAELADWVARMAEDRARWWHRMLDDPGDDDNPAGTPPGDSGPDSDTGPGPAAPEPDSDADSEGTPKPGPDPVAENDPAADPTPDGLDSVGKGGKPVAEGEQPVAEGEQPERGSRPHELLADALVDAVARSDELRARIDELTPALRTPVEEGAFADDRIAETLRELRGRDLDTGDRELVDRIGDLAARLVHAQEEVRRITGRIEYDRLAGERQGVTREREFLRAKITDRARNLGLLDPAGWADLGPDAREQIILRLDEETRYDSVEVGAGIDEVPTRVRNPVGEQERQHRRDLIRKLIAQTAEFDELGSRLRELDRRIAGMETDQEFLDRPRPAEVTAELERPARERAAELQRIKPRRAMRDDLAGRLGLLDEGGDPDALLAPGELDTVLGDLRARAYQEFRAGDLRPSRYQQRLLQIDALADAARDVNEAHHRIGRLQDEMARVAGVWRGLVEAEGGRMVTDRVGVVEGDEPRIIVFGPRPDPQNPRAGHDAALERALRESLAAAQAMVRPETTVEYRRVLAGREDNWRVQEMDSPEVERMSTGWVGGRRLDMTRWRDAAGEWHPVDPTRPGWQTNRDAPDLPKKFGQKDLPDGVSGWASEDVINDIVLPGENVPAGKIPESTLPVNAPMAPSQYDTSGVDPKDLFSQHWGADAYNVMRLVLMAALVPKHPAVKAWIQRHPEIGRWVEARPWLQKLPPFGTVFRGYEWFAPPETNVQPMHRRWQDSDHIPASAMNEIPAGLRREWEREAREWAEVQQWADLEYERFLGDATDVDRV
ncbi:hypothetical protein, partial [Nocardia sp. NPDC003345]